MSWVAGEHCKEVKKSLLDELSEVKGELTTDEARIWFSRFCKSSFFFTINLLTGKKLDPYQELKLRSMFLRDFVVNIEGRGIGKSFTICFFIVLYAIFNPGVKIGICSGTFRQSKLIFKQIEKWAEVKEGKFLKQCITKVKHSNDGYEMTIGSSTVEALPLTEKIRGKRFHKVIIDEYLLVPKEMVSTVIRPFLTAKPELTYEEQKIQKMEDNLIAEGLLAEADRRQFPSNSIIGLSSASYKFEDLYTDIYLPYCQRIQDPNAQDVNHLVWKMSYEAVKDNGRLDLKLINEAKETSSKVHFDREYRAVFTDESGGFYNYQSILAATVPVDHQPMIKVRGDAHKKYILGIDPNYSESDTADHFAMCVIELDEDNRAGAVVHAYALANSKISKRSEYLKYILENFNIVYLIVDSAGGLKFLSDAEQFLSGLPKVLTDFPDTFLDGEDGLRAARCAYDLSTGKIVHNQVFSKHNWIRLANENLQYQIEHRKVLFGGRMGDRGAQIAMNQDIPIESLEFGVGDEDPSIARDALLAEFVDHLNELVGVHLPKELTLIELKTSATGHHTFDLPGNLKDPKNPRRARRDSYTALLLASWGMKCYYDLHSERATMASFVPFFADLD